MKRIVMVVLVLAVPVSMYSDDFSKVGTAAAQFLKIGAGARASAMGESFVAVANDVSALYWNPAGITGVQSLSLNASHTRWFADITHNYAGLVVPVGEAGAIGLSVLTLNVGEQEVTTVENPDGNGIFYGVNDLAIGISYARALTDRFSVGITGKYIQQNAYNEYASTVAMDLGTYLRTGFHSLVIAMCVSNFGGNMKLEGTDLIALADINKNVSGEYNPDARLKTEAWPLPLNFRVGIAMDIVGNKDQFFVSDVHRFTLAIDANHPNDNVERMNIGGEYAWDETIFARAGYKLNYDVERWTFGGGVSVGIGNQQVGFDYAMVSYGDLGKVSRMSLEIKF
ncbi:MAG: PorV/PorQ family protein [Ignavibacteriales bacterium]|nr:PorV/PorQ family protein [Ignavibacteriales bacterium]